MATHRSYTPEELHYLKMLSRQYPNLRAAGTEIINLQAILNLPKGCEHFISDVHGEYEAFLHLMNSCSGVIRERIDLLFSNSISREEREQLATLIYYPEEKMELLRPQIADMDEWYRVTLHRLIMLCRLVSERYTRSKVRKALPASYAYILEELLYTHGEEVDKRDYFENIIATIIEIGQAPEFIIEVCELIKWAAVDQLHIVGDIFDRGPRADIIMDSLMKHHSVDIQWGNHDVLWMGAASGSRTLVATVLANSIHYNNLEVVETGYGISLRPLSVFANEVYKHHDVSRFAVKLSGDDAMHVSEKDRLLSARMHKAITVILFKLEGQKILRHPEYGMDDRLLLDKIDYENKCITIRGVTWPLEDTDFPTVDPADPYTLTPEESEVIDRLTASFRRSEKLQRHVSFLYSKGSVYKTYNGNLLLHGCIPMTETGEMMSFRLDGTERRGKDFLDYLDVAARQAYYTPPNTPERKLGMDLLWFLWAGRNSPIFGRDRMTTFERRLIADESAWTEPKNAYYTLYEDPEVCDRILHEFGLEGPHCHIINGHIPVKAKKGESPIKGGGKLLVIDGGFCKAYQSTSGIAGYTLIYNSRTLRIVAHQPFVGRERAIRENYDIASATTVFERMESRQKIRETDIGRELQARIDDLRLLLEAYRDGAVTEIHRTQN
ncbi:MAG: fructose-1,6-bisphosphatase [Oscillospiraceae bacterium]|nr:fructose-1,6-bisphosphatase [Oscillospiraceae bacterium]